MQLRDYQISGEADIRAAFATGARRVVYVAPTGSGKTVLFCDMAIKAAMKGYRVCILVHRRELVRQVSQCLGQEILHGIIGQGYTPRPSEVIQIAMAQTLVRRLERYPRFDFIIIDEAHHTVADTWHRIINYHCGAYVLGVTATPCRLDGRGMGDVFEALVPGPSVRDLTPQWLAPARVYVPSGSPINTTGVHRRAGDYIPSELEAVVNRRSITGDAIEHYRRYADGLPAVVFCTSVQHAQDTAAQFCEAGYRFVCVHAATPDVDRDRAVMGLSWGDSVTNCDLFSEGVDVPGLVAGIMLRPTLSLGWAMQTMGRCLRKSPGKSHAIILDHAGNCLRHGLPDTPREWTLTAGAVHRPPDPDGIGPVRICPQCFAAHETGPVCPYCGHVYEIKPRTVATRGGELLLMTRDERVREERDAGSFEELLALEISRGYKAGWACARARARGEHIGLKQYQATARARGYARGWAWGAAKRAGVV